MTTGSPDTTDDTVNTPTSIRMSLEALIEQMCKSADGTGSDKVRLELAGNALGFVRALEIVETNDAAT